MLETVLVARGRQKLARDVQSILPPMSPAAVAAGVKQEFTASVEQPEAHNRTTNEILHAVGRSGHMSVSDTRMGSRRD